MPLRFFSAPTNDNDATPVLYMKEYDSYGSVSNSIYNGSYAFNGTMKLYEEGQSAVLTSESGTRWYDRQGRGNTLKTIKISKLNDTDFLLNYKNNYFRYDWRGITQGNSECKFSLTKIH